MPTAQPPFGSEAASPMWRRLLAGLVVLLAVALVAVLVARWQGGGPARPASPTTTTPSANAPVPSQALSPTATPSADATGSGPLRTQSPTDFAKAFAAALWSYDTRTTSQPQHLAALKKWLTDESKYADPASIESQVPTADVWQQMHADQQYATVSVTEAHIPSAFNQAITANPAALTTAYIYAVTVTGTQSIFWTASGQGAESRAVTLAVQCRPYQDCALASIATTVYP